MFKAIKRVRCQKNNSDTHLQLFSLRVLLDLSRIKNDLFFQYDAFTFNPFNAVVRRSGNRSNQIRFLGDEYA